MILGIYGSGGSGCDLRELAELQGTWEELVFIDDTVEEGIYKGLKRMPLERFCQAYGITKAEVVIAQGEPEYKIMLYERVKEKGFSFANLIHPRAYVSRRAQLGEGIVVQANAYVSCDTTIEDNVHILPGAVVGHDCVIHAHCQISPGVALGGGTEVGEGTYIGLNASVKERIKIGANAVISMGAVLMEDISENRIVLGNPARPIKYKGDSKVFRVMGERKISQSNNQEKYDNAFEEGLGISKEQLDDLKRQAVQVWDSAMHMNLIVALEDVFSIVMEKEDIIEFRSYEKGKEILTGHYGIEF